MRLIDADELKKVIFSKTDSMEDLWDTAGVLNAINNTPTIELQMGRMTNGVIIPIERAQGEWTIIDEDHTSFRFKICSNCGKEAEWLDGGSQLLSNFCPNCGADMRSKKEVKNE